MSDNNDDNNDENTSTSRRIIAPSAPAGLIVFTQPPASVTSFYKIAPSNTLTFGWNFTYVQVEPTSLLVSARCANGNTYPVGPTDGLIPGTATEVTWDLYSYQVNHPNNPLPQTSCQLMIADAERGFDSRQRPGYLNPNTEMNFALYTPQAYTALADGWRCTVCSSASSLVTHPAAISLLVTVLICFLSGFQLLRTTHGGQH